jgi:hypothetical protein
VASISAVSGPLGLTYESATGEVIVAADGSNTVDFVTESDPLLNGYVAVKGTDIGYADGNANMTLYASASYHSWTNNTNGWVNDMGFCAITHNQTLSVDGVPNACSDPPGPSFITFTLPGITTYLNLEANGTGYPSPSSYTVDVSSIMGPMVISSPSDLTGPLAELPPSPIEVATATDEL